MINKLKEKFLSKQFLSFAIIGGINTIGSLLIYMVCVSIHIAVATSSLIGDVTTMIFSYFLNMHFTYHTKPSFKSFVTFPLSYIPGFIINMLITVIMVDTLGAPELLAKAFALPITIPLNYVVMSIIVKWSSKKEVA
ncbi:MAG: GtrA family protein [Erysipelotrichaceae bacterium]